MPVLHLGVIDIPYSQAPRKRQRKATAGTVTTGQVAEWLEEEYHVMEVFAAVHEEDIVHDLENGLVGVLEGLLMGAPPNMEPFASGCAKVEEQFKDFLDKKEMETLGYPGVPTQAALSGKSARFKGRRGSPRPSFIDTGLYQSSFKATVD